MPVIYPYQFAGTVPDQGCYQRPQNPEMIIPYEMIHRYPAGTDEVDQVIGRQSLDENLLPCYRPVQPSPQLNIKILNNLMIRPDQVKTKMYEPVA